MKYICITLVACIGLLPAGAHTINETQQEVREKTIPADTTITYTLDGAGGEGAEAITRYIKGHIRTSDITVFRETGQSRILYTFSNSRIMVKEQQYRYKGGLESVKDKDDMQLKKTIRYTMDINGVSPAEVDEDRTDIFAVFRDSVPLELE